MVALLAATAGWSVGCSTLGPRTVAGDRFAYNQAGAQSVKEQLLLNLVRLSQGKPLYFVEVASMLSQYSFDAELAASLEANNLHGIYGPALRAAYPVTGDDVIEPRRLTNVGVNLQYSDTPTITYRPLTGEAFANRVMSAIAPDTLIYLAHAGWGIDRLLACCVQQINGISNRMVYCDDEQGSPDAPAFDRLCGLLARLQDRGVLRFAEEADGGVMRPICYITDASASDRGELRELRQLLGYPVEGELRLRVTNSPVRVGADELAIETRSVLATMYAISRECFEAPTNGKGASPWMRVSRAGIPQADPHVQICESGNWYYISKSDWTSKRTFALLSYLFSLQAAPSTGQEAPLVSIPAGR